MPEAWPWSPRCCVPWCSGRSPCLRLSVGLTSARPSYMCPDRELNWGPFHLQAGAQSSEPHQPCFSGRWTGTEVPPWQQLQEGPGISIHERIHELPLQGQWRGWKRTWFLSGPHLIAALVITGRFSESVREGAGAGGRPCGDTGQARVGTRQRGRKPGLLWAELPVLSSASCSHDSCLF